MILLGVIGTTDSSQAQVYSLQDITVHAKLSLLALHELLSPSCSEIIVFGTKVAIEKQRHILQEFQAQRISCRSTDLLTIKEIPAGQSQQQESEFLFQTILEEVRRRDPKEICMDLTQGFRHHSMLMFLVGLLQGLSGMKLNLYYSMIKCQEEKSKIQHFECVDLVSFLEIGYMSLILQLFPTSFNIPSFIQLQHKEFNNVKSELGKVAQAILENNLDTAVAAAESAAQQVDTFLKSQQGQFLQAQASGTVQLLQELRQLQKQTKAQKMLQFGRMFLQRHYFLNAATFLHEGLLKLIREITDFDALCLRKDVKVASLEYKASQTIKMLMRFRGGSVPARTGTFVHLNQVGIKREVAEYLQPATKLREYYEDKLAPLRVLDSLIEAVAEVRNNAAHGFIDGTGPQTYQKQLEAYFVFVEKLEKQHGEVGFIKELGKEINQLPGMAHSCVSKKTKQ